MKMIKIVLFLMVVVGCSQCRLYTYEDYYYSCLAGEENNPSYCEKIKNNDQKYLCLAKYYNLSDYCEKIKNSKDRSFCLIITK
jgi:hypothetical protein